MGRPARRRPATPAHRRGIGGCRPHHGSTGTGRRDRAVRGAGPRLGGSAGGAGERRATSRSAELAEVIGGDRVVRSFTRRGTGWRPVVADGDSAGRGRHRRADRGPRQHQCRGGRTDSWRDHLLPGSWRPPGCGRPSRWRRAPRTGTRCTDGWSRRPARDRTPCCYWSMAGRTAPTRRRSSTRRRSTPGAGYAVVMGNPPRLGRVRPAPWSVRGRRARHRRRRRRAGDAGRGADPAGVRRKPGRV